MAEEEKDDWLDDMDDDKNSSADFDQSELDSLLSDDDKDVAAEAGADSDRSDVDSLLSDDDDASSADSDPSQAEIDQLFSEVDDNAAEAEAAKDDPFQAEEIDFEDLATDSDEDFALEETVEGFDAEEFGLDDDIPDIPEDEATAPTVLEGAETGAADTDLTGDEATQFLESTDNQQDQKDKKPLLPPILQNRKVQAIAGGCAVFIIIAVIFLFKGRPAKEEQTAAKPTTELAQQPAPSVNAKPETPAPLVDANNKAPQVKDAEIFIAKGDKELDIKLNATDAENDPLDYEILALPEYGRLSGQAPNLIYLPNENFPGHDSLTFRVSDSHHISTAANIKITTLAPPPVPAVTITPKEPTTAPITPQPTKHKDLHRKPLVIAAQNKAYKLSSTKSLSIDWQKLWTTANYLPFTPKIRVQIVSSNLHGKLYKTNSRHYRYQPDKYFGGIETIKYRFRLAKLKSQVKRLTLNIKPGRPAPEIHLTKIAASYYSGERVVLDASSSRDEDRSSLLFSWKQISGVPIQFEMRNTEGSLIDFIAPSTFNTVTNPGPVLRLTVIDKDGKRDNRTIKIATQSRRSSAVWNNIAEGEEDF